MLLVHVALDAKNHSTVVARNYDTDSAAPATRASRSDLLPTLFRSWCENLPEIPQSAERGARGHPTDVRSMAPSKRRKTSAVLEPACGNATSGVRTRRSARARGDPPEAPDADLEPVDECATFSPDGNVATGLGLGLGLGFRV